MAFLGGDMSNHRVRVFSTTFKEEVVRRLESGEALAAVAKQLGIARKLLYEWRWAWRGQGEGADRRAGASGWSSTIGPLFFSQGLAACRRASGTAPGAWRDQLYALIKDLSAAEKSQGENETTSAPEQATHEVQHLCQLA